MSEVLAVNSQGNGMSHYLGRAVTRHGWDLFREVWTLEAIKSSDGRVYRVVALRDGRTVELTDPMLLVDFALFWDGFRLCASEMRR
jgi:hypothetical protein